MAFIKLLIFALSSLAAATSKRGQDASQLRSALKSVFPNSSQLTAQVLSTFLQPLEASIARSSPITRNGTQLKLLGQPWHANGANVYWLGIDENVIPPAGEPFYAALNASYPTKGRVTEAMATLVTMGAHLIRSQTLGISVGNPLSLEPELGVWNEQAFDTIDWAVWQARQHGLRILPPLTDNYVCYVNFPSDLLADNIRIITTVENSLSFVGPATISQAPKILSRRQSRPSILTPKLSPYSKLTLQNF
jgi:mannan endo-1,4-beta-mannosidase